MHGLSHGYIVTTFKNNVKLFGRNSVWKGDHGDGRRRRGRVSL